MTSARVPTVKRADGITRSPSGDATARSVFALSAGRATSPQLAGSEQTSLKLAAEASQ
jgi:hypothetical protein